MLTSLEFTDSEKKVDRYLKTSTVYNFYPKDKPLHCGTLTCFYILTQMGLQKA